MPVGGTASLPMYPFAPLTAHWQTLWTAVHQRMPGSRPELEWPDDVRQVWHDPHLALTQTCGWPLVTDLAGRVRAIGAFDPRLPGAADARYRSVVIARRPAPIETFKRSIAAVNSADSLSGWISLSTAVLGCASAWEGETIETGAHVQSVDAVRRGLADIASIDAVTLALIRDLEPERLDGLSVVGNGPRVPCLPLVVPAATPSRVVRQWREAFAGACEDPETRTARQHLRIRGFVPLDNADYSDLLTLTVVSPSPD